MANQNIGLQGIIYVPLEGMDKGKEKDWGEQLFKFLFSIVKTRMQGNFESWLKEGISIASIFSGQLNLHNQSYLLPGPSLVQAELESFILCP